VAILTWKVLSAHSHSDHTRGAAAASACSLPPAVQCAYATGKPAVLIALRFPRPNSTEAVVH